MKYNNEIENLDVVLKFFAVDLIDSKADFTWIKNYFKENKIPVSEAELLRSINKLKDDKYIQFDGKKVVANRGGYQNTFFQSGTELYSITHEGIELYNKNGYKGKRKNENLNKYTKRGVAIFLFLWGAFFTVSDRINNNKINIIEFENKIYKKYLLLMPQTVSKFNFNNQPGK